MLIVLCGLPLTGKSTTAKQLAKDLNGMILRTDNIRRELFLESMLEEVLISKKPMRYDLEKIFDGQESIPNKYQEMIWKQKQMVYDELLKRIERLLTEGQIVILDGTFFKKSLRESVYSIAKKTNTLIYLIECLCSEDCIRERLLGREKVPDESSNVDKMQIYQKVKENYEKPTEAKDSVPIILYDTGLQKIETINISQKDEVLGLLLNSLNKLKQTSR